MEFWIISFCYLMFEIIRDEIVRSRRKLNIGGCLVCLGNFI